MPIGPILGGWLLTNYWWGWVFLINVPVIALGLAGWVAIAIVPNLARRTNLRWVVSQIDYKLTREGMVYLGVVGILILASVNTGNNLLFMILACSLAGIVMSGVLSRAVLVGVEIWLGPTRTICGSLK